MLSTVSSQDLIETLDLHLKQRDDHFFQSFQDGLDSLVKSKARESTLIENENDKPDQQELLKERESLNESFLKLAEVTTYLTSTVRRTVTNLAELEGQNQELQSQNQDFVHRLEELHVAMAQKGEHIRELTEELTKAENEVQQLCHRLDDSQSRLASYDVLQKDYEKLEKENQQKSVDLLKKETEMANLVEELSKNEGLSTTHSSELEEKYAKIESLYDEISELKEHNHKLSLEQLQQGNLICTMQSTIEELEDANNELRSQKKRQTELIEGLELELECSQSSHVVERHFTLDRAGTISKTRRGTAMNQDPNSLFDELVTDEINDFNTYKRRETAILETGTPMRTPRDKGRGMTPGSGSEDTSPARMRRVVQLTTGGTPHSSNASELAAPLLDRKVAENGSSLGVSPVVGDRIVPKSHKRMQEKEEARLLSQQRKVEETDGEVSRSMKIILDREKDIADQKKRIREQKQKKNFYFFGLRPMTMLNAFSEFVSEKEMETAPPEEQAEPKLAYDVR